MNTANNFKNSDFSEHKSLHKQASENIILQETHTIKTNDLLNSDKFIFKNKIQTTINFLKKKRKRRKFKKTIGMKKNKSSNDTLNDSTKNENTRTKSNMEDSSFSEKNFEESSINSHKSLSNERYEFLKKKKEKLEIRNIKTSEKVSFEKIKRFFAQKDIECLKIYKFTYMSQNDFNHIVANVNLRHFRKLYFECPLCNQPFRHFSMSYHIFQNHFDSFEELLTTKNKAHCCAKLMINEFKKIEKSLALFSELAILYESYNFVGASEWRRIAEEQIKVLKKLDVKKKYFNINKEMAVNLLCEKFPLNKNKRYKK